jgi:hypothetical protein
VAPAGRTLPARPADHHLRERLPAELRHARLHRRRSRGHRGGDLHEIQRQAAPAEPFLVYLRPADIAAAIARVHQARGEPWSSRNLAFVQDSPWARRRGLRGRGAVVGLYQAWEPVAAGLFDRYPFGKLMLPDPQHD